MALSRPTRLLLAILMLVAAGALLYAAGVGRQKGSATAVSGDLTISWSKAKDGLNIEATGYRRRSAAQVSVASQPKHQVTADDTGTVRLFVALDAATQGQVGTTVVVSGRAPSNATRSLVGGVPPLAVGRGLEDTVPWVAAGLLALAAAGVAGIRPHRNLPAGGRHKGRRRASPTAAPATEAGAAGRSPRRRPGAQTPASARIRVSTLLARSASEAAPRNTPVSAPGPHDRPLAASVSASTPATLHGAAVSATTLVEAGLPGPASSSDALPEEATTPSAVLRPAVAGPAAAPAPPGAKRPLLRRATE